MRSRDRLLPVVLVLLLVVLVKVGQEVVRFYAYGEERATIARLEGEIEAAGLGVVRSQIEADSVRRMIESADEKLASQRAELDRYERQITVGPVTVQLERAYRAALADYNDHVQARNRMLEDWQRVVEANRIAVDRYNAIADSIRVVAAAMGEPYYPIRTPADIANRIGSSSPDE